MPRAQFSSSISDLGMPRLPRRGLVLLLSSAFAFILLFPALCLLAQKEGAPAGEQLRSVRSVRTLDAESAGQAHRVDLRGVVTTASGWKNSFFFQDSSGGISVDRNSALPKLAPGELVEIEGKTGSGKFAPVVIADSIKILGTASLPRPHPLTSADLRDGALDSQWVSVQGIVRSAAIRKAWQKEFLFLDIETNAGALVTAQVLDFSKNEVSRLSGSVVSVSGACGTIFNDKRQFMGLKIFVSSLKAVQVLRPAPIDPFDRPLDPLSGLGRFGPRDQAIEPVRVRGIVTYFADQALYIQDKSQGALVRGAQILQVSPGDEVEVVGFPGGDSYSPSLEGAFVRVIKKASGLVAPQAVAAHNMIAEKDGFPVSPYDSLLVQIRGQLIETFPSVDDDQVLLIRDGDRVFSARLPKTSNLSGLPAIGSWVSATGVCVTRLDSNHEIRSFRVLLQSTADLVVLKAAPWWNPEHATRVVIALVIAVVMLAIALLAVRREAQLRHLTLVDPLTSLYNRRGFVLLAGHEWQLALRRGTPMLLFYMDIDQFKEINDTLGHKQGDAAIQAAADILRTCFRQTDLIGRLGGDEFAVAAIDATPHSRLVLESRLNGLLDEFNTQPDRKFTLSLSVGVLRCDDTMSGQPFEDLLDEADKLMYRKKRERKTLLLPNLISLERC